MTAHRPRARKRRVTAEVGIEGITSLRSDSRVRFDGGTPTL
jgi:hypothetical protein